MEVLIKRHFYLLCMLPGLGDWGSVPPVSKQNLLTVVTESEGPVDIVQALLLSEDLLQREAVLAGEREPGRADLAVLSLKQANDEEPLPLFLRTDRKEAGGSSDYPVAADSIWHNYFQHAFETGRLYRTPFLQAWVGFEVGMRNALTGIRAEALNLDPGPYMVAQELGDPEFPFESIVADWTAALNPLEAHKVLEKARWNWVTEHEGWYRFSNDEVAAYTVKTMILHRWREIAPEDKQ
jgi:hypothetical protein